MILHEKAIPPMLAFLSYNENDFMDYVFQTIPRAKSEFHLDEHGEHFYGWVGDKRTDTLYFWYRGTDGIDKFGNFKSWLTNVNVFTGDDGTHNGFQGVAKEDYEFAKPHIHDYHHHMHIGHSQGGGEAQVSATISANECRLGRLHLDGPVEAIVYAAPPSGNMIFRAMAESLIFEKLLTGKRYLVPDDPIASKLFRNKNIPLLAGEDVFDEIILPQTLRYTDRPGLNVLAHSSQQYMAGLIWLELDKDEPDMSLLKSYHWIQERLVN